jgi:hypothetical protein
VVGEVGSLQISLGEVRVDLLEARRARSKGVEFVLVLAVVGDELGVRRARNDVLLTWKRDENVSNQILQFALPESKGTPDQSSGKS